MYKKKKEEKKAKQNERYYSGNVIISVPESRTILFIYKFIILIIIV